MLENAISVSPAKQVSFPQTARSCGIKVLLSLLGIVALSATVGMAIDHREVLENALHAAWTGVLWAWTNVLWAWEKLLWVMALGGHLWGSVFVGGAALGVLGWVCCVKFQLPAQEEDQAHVPLLFTGALSATVWVLATVALQATFNDFDLLTVYESIAVCVLNLPYVVIFFAALGASMLAILEAAL